MYLCGPRVSLDFLGCHFTKNGTCQLGFHEASLGVLLLQHSPGYVPETQRPALSLVALWCEVS
jgi:hypothetical protein